MKGNILIILVLVIFISGCGEFNLDNLEGSSSGQIKMCSGVYELDSSLGYEITGDSMAFDILKEGHTYDSSEDIHVEDRIPENSTLNDVLGGYFKKNQEISLDSGETVIAWTIGYGSNTALDSEGNKSICL